MVRNLFMENLVTLALCLSAATAFGQSPLATIHGHVLDPSRTPIAGARVSVGESNNTTGPGGEFEVDSVAGTTSVQVAATGFRVSQLAVTLVPGRNEMGSLVLDLDPLRTDITVAADAGYRATVTSSATRTLTPLEDIPQAISVVGRGQMDDQLMMSVADVVRYVPGITAIQGENNRDQLVIRGNSTSADFFVNGVRDDVQYYRDLYNLERVEVLKGSNAMVFGRGGGGGVVNRVTKEAQFMPFSSLSLTGGSFGDRRAAVDLGQTAGRRLAWRLNGMYEDSDSFRDYVHLKRRGINPSLVIGNASKSRLVLSYEHFRDHRGADRGIPSFHGLPVYAPVGQFFGNPDQSRVRAHVNSGSALFERQAGTVLLRSRTVAADYDRGYQNFVPGAVSAASLVSISAYNNATARRNVFNQTDATGRFSTGSVSHQWLAGGEAGRQVSNNFRNTGYFGGNNTTVAVALANPVFRTPATFRQSATDADNRVQASVQAGFVQDQIQLLPKLQLIGGMRFDRVAIRYFDNRTATARERIDPLISPRAGLVFKPLTTVSLYGSYSVSWLPGSGDQFASLTSITEQLKPEKFTNYETGVKWTARRNLSVTLAAYRLDRTNTRATDPNDVLRIIQTGSQRSEGVELGASGSLARRWHVTGGYALQDVVVTSATAAAPRGAHTAQTPRQSYSLWNLVELRPRLEAGLGIVGRSNMFAAIDNTVTLPGYARVDGGLFYSWSEHVRLQANVENLSGRRYYSNADNNTNISPGSPRSLRLGLTLRF